VFLRTIAAHRGALTELRPNRAAAGAALARAIDCDCLILDLIFVEYAAERQPDTGGFQKHAAFRAGPHIIRAYTASDVGWMAKTGSEGVASKAQYRAERDEMDHCPHRNSVMRVFEFAGLQFGRLYFDIVAGRPQAYDINTNPSMTQTVTHPNATRRETMGLVQSRLASALADLTQRVSRLPW